MEKDCSVPGDDLYKQNFVTALNGKYSCDDAPMSVEIHIPKSAPGRTGW